jgi:hypothetical protein
MLTLATCKPVAGTFPQQSAGLLGQIFLSIPQLQKKNTANQ